MSISGGIVARAGCAVVLLATVLLSGCAATPSPVDRRAHAEAIAQAAGFEKLTISANGFVVLAYRRNRVMGAPLTVYIEGDGYAWKNRRHLSDDPTPTDPVALRLAVQDPSANVVYLARPCQYVAGEDRQGCDADYWSSKRFAEEVIHATDQALDSLRAQAQAAKLSLIGYSGGGAVAVLVAARRTDVVSLRTVAGTLNHVAFTDRHGVTPLQGSLNPIDQAAALSAIPQHHFVGGADTIIPSDIAREFVNRANTHGCATLTVVPEATHFEGWVALWPALLSRPFPCLR